MSEHPRPHPDLGGYVLGLLEPVEAAAFEEHLATCAVCRDEVAELSTLPALLDEAPPPATPPESLRHRTLRAVERDVQLQRRRRLVTGATLAAAAMLLVIAVVAQPFRPAPFRLELAAADGGEASGIADITRTEHGRRIDMVLQDLPASPPGTHYECWYVGDGDRHDAPERVTGGTFVALDGGDVTVTMFTAGDPHEYPGMDVTLEPDDGDPGRSGKVVLTSQ